MVQELPLTYLHVFTYSSRPGTPATEMARQVAPGVARERNRVLREIAANKKRHFMRSFVGRELTAITLSGQSAEATDALTDNYLKLRLLGRHEPNQWIRTRIEAADGDSLAGSFVELPLAISL
jgi:threonylcarbamoyladenosine tRNA methylthiotransferase MtaB